jgi:outer membrane receptor for ferrienterochelin and colicin
MLCGFADDPPLARLDGRVDTGRFATGVHRALSAQWSITGTMGYAVEHQRDVEHDLANFSYEATHDRNIGFDAPGEGGRANPLGPVEIWAYHSTFTHANLSGTGPLFSLPAGPVSLTLGSDYRLQTLRTSLSAPELSSAPPTDRDRTALAVFAHSTLPLLGSDVGTETTAKLQLSLGLRWEHFNDSGSAWSPFLGLVFSPHPDWTVQGTWVRLPPNLPDLGTNRATPVNC